MSKQCFVLAAALAASLTAWWRPASPQPPSGTPAAASAPATPASVSPPASTPSAAAAPVPAATLSLANLDLSRGELGKEPPGWYVPATMKTQGYSAAVVAEHPEGGTRSALLQAPAGGPPPPVPPFGALVCYFDAASFRGQRVRFRATVKVAPAAAGETAGAAAPKPKDADADEIPPPRAELAIRVELPGGKPGPIYGMDDLQITSAAWSRYEVAADVPADAGAIKLVLALYGSGRAWISAASFQAIDKKAVGALAPPRPLDPRGLDNLVAFARLAGLVRYFHPSDQAATADWSGFVRAGVQQVEGATGPEELARSLTTLFLPLAPTVRIFPSDRPEPPAAEMLAPPAGIAKPRVVAWRHDGLGLGTTSRNVYKSERIDNRTPPSGPESAPPEPPLPEPGKPFAADLGGGVSALVPLALYAGEHGTLPEVPAGVQPVSLGAAEGFVPSGNDRTTRLADVVLAWNVFEHFYPYFDVVGTDWPAELRRALRSAATDRDEKAFLETLRRLVAALHDGHADVTSDRESPARLVAPPLLWDWVEDRLVITQVDRQHAAGIEPGDVVTAIDGRPAAQAIAAKEELISAATPQWRRRRALRELLAGPPGSVELRVQHPSGAVAAVTLTRSLPLYGDGALEERRPAKIAEVAPGILYVDLGRVDEADFKGALDRMAKARGLVFDLRGYPKLPPVFLQHLSDKVLLSAHWHVPIITRPDRQQMTFDEGHWTLEPIAPLLRAKKAFLIDGRAISYAESCLGIVEHYHLADLVGMPTAGTNGNVNFFSLPGGYRIPWTGMQVIKHDGSRHHGVGILPTIPVAPTIQGIAAGRDEVLERGIAAVSR
jgi:C-terminal processing protease CtpA/Prc